MMDTCDPWRPLNVFIHGPGAIGQIVKCKWYNYASDGQNPTSCCDSGEYYYFYDALGNVNGVLDEGGHYYRWEMDAFGNDLPGGNAFLAMDQPGAKEHLTGKMFDTTTGLYYFHARWYDPHVGRFVSRGSPYTLGGNDPANVSNPSGEGDNPNGEATNAPSFEPDSVNDCEELCPTLKKAWKGAKQYAQWLFVWKVQPQNLQQCIKDYLPKMWLQCGVCPNDQQVAAVSDFCDKKGGLYFCANNRTLKTLKYCCDPGKVKDFEVHLASTLVHEAAHLCNWRHGQGRFVPRPKRQTDEKEHGPYEPCPGWGY